MRTTVKALYRGKPVVWPVDEITHFHAAEKYVIAHHVDGRELLLTDTIKALNDEFRESFLLIKRGSLVARRRIVRIEPVFKQFAALVYLRGVSGPLPCSRARLPVVCEIMRCA